MSNSSQPSNLLVKPTLETRFHIDYSWWQRDGRDLRAYMISHLSPEQRERFTKAGDQPEVEIDRVDPETGEVTRVDSLRLALQDAARSPEYLADHVTLVDAVFRVFIANGNKPMTPVELGAQINRPPMTILRTLAGQVVYRGLRPAISSETPEK